MTPCYAVSFETTDGFVLRGLWFGPKKPKRVIILVHGLAGSMFGSIELKLAGLLTDTQTAVLVFNNRGHDIVSKLYKDAPKTKKGYTRIVVGAAHEKFTDCVHDIQGAINFVHTQKVKDIYLAGHSTGCQKSMYWACKEKSRGVRGIILLAPVSDWAAETFLAGKEAVARAAKAARALVSANKKHELLPTSLWSAPLDAQRFLSLYTPDSIEEIFSYSQPKKNPSILKGVKAPVLVLWAAEDQYSDRPAEEIVAWFDKHLHGKHKVIAIPGANHSFQNKEKETVRTIRDFIQY